MKRAPAVFVLAAAATIFTITTGSIVIHDRRDANCDRAMIARDYRTIQACEKRGKFPPGTALSMVAGAYNDAVAAEKKAETH